MTSIAFSIVDEGKGRLVSPHDRGLHCELPSCEFGQTQSSPILIGALLVTGAKDPISKQDPNVVARKAKT